MWQTEYIEYGVIDFRESEVRVYKDRWNYIRVICNRNIERAYWAGRHLILALADGSVRRYRDYMNYEVVR
jgi:hypothetical protein